MLPQELNNWYSPRLYWTKYDYFVTFGGLVHIKGMSKDEIELIARIVNGESECYRTLVDRYKQDMYRHCFFIVHDEDDAEDAAQEAFIRAYVYIKRFDPEKASFKTWLYTIGTRECLQTLRKRRTLPLTDEDLLESTLAPTDQIVRDHELRDAVLALPTNYQAVITLHYWHGESYQAIATSLQVPIGTVRGWLHRAKQQLKEALS